MSNNTLSLEHKQAEMLLQIIYFFFFFFHSTTKRVGMSNGLQLLWAQNTSTFVLHFTLTFRKKTHNLKNENRADEIDIS